MSFCQENTKKTSHPILKDERGKKVVWAGRNFRITNRYINFLHKFLPFILKPPTQRGEKWPGLCNYHHIETAHRINIHFPGFYSLFGDENRHKLISLSLKEEGKKIHYEVYHVYTHSTALAGAAGNEIRCRFYPFNMFYGNSLPWTFTSLWINKKRDETNMESDDDTADNFFLMAACFGEVADGFSSFPLGLLIA